METKVSSLKSNWGSILFFLNKKLKLKISFALKKKKPFDWISYSMAFSKKGSKVPLVCKICRKMLENSSRVQGSETLSIVIQSFS